MDILCAALNLAKDEWDGSVKLVVDRLEIADELPAIDIRVTHKSGMVSDGRVFVETLPDGLPRTSALEQVRRWWNLGSLSA